MAGRTIAESSDDVAVPSNRVLLGQSALVTGASSGLGRRFARVLAGAGAKVAVAARRSDRLEELVLEIRAAGGTAEAIPMDLNDLGSIPGAVDAAERAVGRVSILVNNAGLPFVGSLLDQELDAIQTVMNVNLMAPLLLSREIAKRIIASGGIGRIVNISSINASVYTGLAPTAVYSMTKAAITRMTEVLAIEWARDNINVNAIAPGLFMTEMMSSVSAEHLKIEAAKMPRGRMGEPHHLDSTLMYLVAPTSEFVTGVCITVDDAQFSR